MDAYTRSFIEKTTLLFIASRDAESAMDVSPRGGQPSVLRVRADGSLLLPDYVGNRRLDTISNVLSNPDVALLLLNRHSEEYLRITARASLSRDGEDFAAFPADESRPLSVIVLTPAKMEFVSTAAFRDSGFWIDPAERKPPLDVLDIYARDIRWQAESGRKPVLSDAAAEGRLAESGLRDLYGMPSPLVQTKVYDTAGPGFMTFISNARFIVFAHEGENGELMMSLLGGSPLRLDPDANRQSFLLDVKYSPSAKPALSHSTKCALLAAEPGRCENIRINGDYREVSTGSDGQSQLTVYPEEIYFHCSAAFSRSRIWTDRRSASWSGRRSFTCVSRKQESPDVMSFVLRPRDNASVGHFAPGQYVTVSLPGEGRLARERRCYSISGVPDEHSLRISVRRIGTDGVSAVLHDKIGVGDEILLGAPAGQFLFDSAPLRPVVFISAGVGITPLLPMAENLAGEAAERPVWFIHAARNARHHLFKEEALRIATANSAIKLLTAYSQPEIGDICDHKGRLDAASIAAHVPVNDADFYVCGPDAFMSSLKQGLIELGAVPESIRTEAFERSSGGLAVALLGELAGHATCTVDFARSAKCVTWKPESGSLLDLALANDIDVQYSCRSGECQSCTQRIVSGQASYPTGEEPLLARGQVLLCQAIPRGNIVLDC